MGDDEERFGESAGDLCATVVAPVAVHTKDESTVASSDDETTPEQPRVRTTVEQRMEVDYQRGRGSDAPSGRRVGQDSEENSGW